MAAEDIFSRSTLGRSSPSPDFYMVTPSDANELEFITRAIYIGTPGNLHVINEAGREETIPSNTLAAGVPHSLRVRKIFATGTGASDIMAVK